MPFKKKGRLKKKRRDPLFFSKSEKSLPFIRYSLDITQSINTDTDTDNKLKVGEEEEVLVRDKPHQVETPIYVTKSITNYDN